jgi:hypothetical protein
MELTREEKYIARKLFQLEVYKKTGQAYEDFLVRIMQLCNSEFVPVKPQGRYGDRKNDGFIKSAGKYYQIYSPEEPKFKEKETIDKLVTDFKGLYNYWNKLSPIKEFYFALNDKYNGAYASLYTELAKIEKDYTDVKCFPFLAHHLEDIFLELPTSKIEEVLGPIIDPTKMELFDLSVMNEVINYLLRTDFPNQPENLPENPDFDMKIEFNNLSATVATFLKYSSFQEGELKNYFRLNSTFAKNELRNIFNQLYKKGLSEILETDNKNDLVFFYIMEKACPIKNTSVRNAVLVLMSYFFSYCDIFEEPIKTIA